MKLLKIIIWLFIIFIVEISSYYYFKPKMIENFFAFWGMIFFALLIWNLFNFESNPKTDYLGTIGGKTPNKTIFRRIGEESANKFFDKKFNIHNKLRNSFIKDIITSYNIICLVSLLSNVLGYFISYKLF